MEIEQLRPCRWQAWHNFANTAVLAVNPQCRNELAATQQQNSELKDALQQCTLLRVTSVTSLRAFLSLTLVFPAPEAAIHGG